LFLKSKNNNKSLKHLKKSIKCAFRTSKQNKTKKTPQKNEEFAIIIVILND